MYQLSINSESTVSGEERTAILNGNPIAVALIDTTGTVPDFTLSWHIWDSRFVWSTLDIWLSRLKSEHKCEDEIKLEYYIDNDFYEKTLGSNATSREIASQMRSSYVTQRDEVRFFLVNIQNNVFEAVLGYGEGTIVSCHHSEARLRSIIPVFKEYHCDHLVRADREVSLMLFGIQGDSSQRFLDPVKVIL